VETAPNVFKNGIIPIIPPTLLTGGFISTEYKKELSTRAVMNRIKKSGGVLGSEGY
jgi:hypothetical protein